MKRFNTQGNNSINASSMADVAFLLLIFFLVTTTIVTDKGILTLLPPITEHEPLPHPPHNTLVVLINAGDQLLVNSQPMDVTGLREKAKQFLDNKGADPTMSSSPRMAVISLQNDRGTSYGTYLQVQNELKAAYRELRDAYALHTYGQTFTELKEQPKDNLEKIKEVAEAYPMQLSEAEPKVIGEVMP